MRKEQQLDMCCIKALGYPAFVSPTLVEYNALDTGSGKSTSLLKCFPD